MDLKQNKVVNKKSLYTAKELDAKWNETLLQLARESPVEADGLRIYFDRSPDLFAIPRLTSSGYCCGALFKNDTGLLGFAITEEQRRWVSGKTERVLYYGNMHVSGKGRGQAFFYRTSDLFFGHLPEGITYIYSYIMGTNKPAMSLVNRRHFRFPGVPFSSVIGQITMATILLCIPVGPGKKYNIRPATLSDVPQIVDLLSKEFRQRFLAPVIDTETFMDNLRKRPDFGITNYLIAECKGSIIGVCSVWDMSSLKRNTVVDYGRRMGLIRKAYNLVSPLLGVPRLPPAGEVLKVLTIAEYAVADRKPEILEALLRHIYRSYRGKYHSIIFGSSKDDPLLKATNPFFTIKIDSNVILGAFDQTEVKKNVGQPLIYADAILL